jgi:methylmalonyl-CoA mutase
METMYQRGRIQDESLYYESRKHDGTLPLIGVNTFLSDSGDQGEVVEAELIRSTEQEKREQVAGNRSFQANHADAGPAALARLKAVAARGGNTFAELMEAVKVCTLGQITHALYEVGGQYRRNM